MSNLFTQLYVRMAVALIVVLFVVAGSLFGVMDWRYKRFVQTQVEPVAQLVTEGWQIRSKDSQLEWTNLVASLTNTEWQIVTTDSGLSMDELEITSLSWMNQSSTLRIPLDSGHEAEVVIRDWQDWYIGYGWLLVNAISLQTADQRQAYFETLQAREPWPIDRVNRSVQPLSTLSLRQLTAGQAVLVPVPHQQERLLYMPAGANQVIRIGPVPMFEFFSVAQWFGTITLALLILMFCLLVIIRPLQHRIDAIRRGVKAYASGQPDSDLPTQYNDSLGEMAQQIEGMAKGLVHQAEQNRHLNMAVSHDLKTPLARLKFALSMLETGDREALIEQMDTDIDLLTDLTNELLLYHRLGSTQSEAVANIDVAALLRQQVEMAREASVDIQLVITEPVPEFPIQIGHWRRLVQNLIGNALQYCISQVCVELMFVDDTLFLRVSDDGSGMSADELAVLMQPFRRRDASRQQSHKNFGLGLSLIHVVCQHYGGRLSVGESSLSGACLVISLPYNLGTL